MSTDIHSVFSGGDCPDHGQLLAYFRGELTGEELHRIERHLAECEMCSDELGGLGRMKDPEKLPEIVAGIQAELTARRRRTIPVYMRILLPVAAAVVILILGFAFLFRPGMKEKQEKMTAMENAVAVQPGPANIPPPPPPPSSMQAPVTKTETPLLAAAGATSKREVKKEDQEKNTAVQEPMAILEEAELEQKFLTDSAAARTEEKPAAVHDDAQDMSSNTVAKETVVAGVVSAKMNVEGGKQDKASMDKKQPASPAQDSAMLFFQKAEYRQASVLFGKQLAADSTDSFSRYYLASCYYHLKEYSKARLILTRILSDPDNPYYSRGRELEKKIESEE
jgi:hypothetical protein